MRRFIAVSMLSVGFLASLMAEDFKGVVMDQKCSGNPAMKSNVACIQTCIKGGSPAVLVTSDGTVYKIANQDKVLASAGKDVTLTGKLANDTITVAEVK